MQLLHLSVFLSAVSAVLSVPNLYLVGDSTMALHPASEGLGLVGWGVQFPSFTTGITVVNKAVSGRSARSYWREGKWAAVQALLTTGDYVVIEFGHNDGGSPDTSDRASVVGDGSATQTVTLADGTVEVVQTFPTYLKWMIDGAISKGATPIISSQTPNNPYEGVDTIVNPVPNRFEGYASGAATAKGVPFVSHWTGTISYYEKLGKATVDGYFPVDHTHTNAAGATSVAWAFLSALKCTAAKGVLASYINSAGQGAGARCSV